MGVGGMIRLALILLTPCGALPSGRRTTTSSVGALSRKEGQESGPQKQVPHLPGRQQMPLAALPTTILHCWLLGVQGCRI